MSIFVLVLASGLRENVSEREDNLGSDLRIDLLLSARSHEADERQVPFYW